jgi:hypothetical protein
MQRAIRPTALLFCEGAHDLAFVRHMVSLYQPRGSGTTNIRTKQGHGGAVHKLVENALAVPGDYDRILVKLDSDRGEGNPAELQKAELLAARNAIILNFSYPCLDALLLAILDPNRDYTNWRSATCKKKFEKEYIAPERRTSSLSYGGHFTREVLEEARTRIAELDTLIRFIVS